MKSEKKFLEEAMDKITEAVKAKAGEGYEIICAGVEKNNGVTRPAIQLCKHGTAIRPTMYIDTLIAEVAGGTMSAEEAGCEIMKAFRGCQKNVGRYTAMLEQLNKEEILKQTVYQLVNTESNRKRLEDAPHKEMLDLSVVYRMTVDDDGREWSSLLITNEICKMYGIGLDELDAAARLNTEQSDFLGMPVGDALIALICGEQMDSVKSGTSQDMFILTNNKNTYGATVLLYPEYFDKLARDIGSDLYVLPSSIHETLAVSTDLIQPEYLRKMVHDVNCTVAEEEVLSWNVYRYSRESGCLTIA